MKCQRCKGGPSDFLELDRVSSGIATDSKRRNQTCEYS